MNMVSGYLLSHPKPFWDVMDRLIIGKRSMARLKSAAVRNVDREQGITREAAPAARLRGRSRAVPVPALRTRYPRSDRTAARTARPR